MPVQTRRWNDPARPDDGLRVLVCRYRPRGVSKDDETWEAWMPDLGPSKELHAAYYQKDPGRVLQIPRGREPAGQARRLSRDRGKRGEPLSWPEYQRRYLAEMMEPSGRGAAMLGALAARVAAGETVTLLCSSACTDPERCHRSLLAGLIERGAARLGGRASARPSRR